MNNEIKKYVFCSIPAIGISDIDYYGQISKLMAEQYTHEPFQYIFATEKVLYWLSIAGKYTPYSISHRKKSFDEAVGTIGVEIGQKKRAHLPVVQMGTVCDVDRLVMCKGEYGRYNNVIAYIDFINPYDGFKMVVKGEQ